MKKFDTDFSAKIKKNLQGYKGNLRGFGGQLEMPLKGNVIPPTPLIPSSGIPYTGVGDPVLAPGLGSVGPVNLIINGECEYASIWEATELDVGEFSLRSDEQAHGGAYSWKIGHSGAHLTHKTKSNNFTVTAGRIYEASLWVYPGDDWDGDDNNYGRISFYFGASEGSNHSYIFGFAGYQLGAVTKNQWNHIVFYEEAPETGGFAALGVEFNADYPPACTYLYFDDVSVYGPVV